MFVAPGNTEMQMAQRSQTELHSAACPYLAAAGPATGIAVLAAFGVWAGGFLVMCNEGGQTSHVIRVGVRACNGPRPRRRLALPQTRLGEAQKPVCRCHGSINSQGLSDCWQRKKAHCSCLGFIFVLESYSTGPRLRHQ